MSFDRVYPNRKDHRIAYRRSARFDRSCRTHGSCGYCAGNRLLPTRKLLERLKFDMKDAKPEYRKAWRVNLMADNLIQTAQADVGEREDDGANRSIWIDHINDWLQVQRGSSYCAGAVSLWLHRSGCDVYKSASSQAFKRWADDTGRLRSDPNDLHECTGALGGWTNVDDPEHGHIFVITGRDEVTTGGDVVAVKTIEANTSSGGSANGDGVYDRRRNVQQVPTLWFIDLTGLPGCNYWPKSLGGV